ncbi:UNVERIFIED_CONTAM: PH, RCC1 and FYVE domains-containing protein 1 [Sesamum radiatum]|uniref:PH, RCC1 and FYVE domains-containing protein 1 n=1 Tax=Sesamum radiatum TaxID=300843 RepID=A0AAW2UMA2_SESRA
MRCGHTAAVVEVMVGSSSSSNCSSGKLFTWGDGDKGRLGHGDKESKLVPTCVAALVEPNFCQVACGHSMTVALTTSGHVYTMGSPVYGQLGNPQADGKLPSRVEGKLGKSFVEEIACGAYHVAVLTSRTEVYTWGKGANGRLGHGDADDRNSPTLVEALKDKQVKSIACGTNFTAAICLHKWVSGVDQSMCSGCRLPFNFKRKRHNCYNCGLVFCHSCSSKKSLRASMAPNPNKPYRVCDNCFSKLKKAIETDTSSHSSMSRRGIFGSSKKFFSASVPGSRIVSRATSPISRRTSPPRSTTPTPTLGGLTSPKVVLDDAKMINDSLSQEVITLRAQVGVGSLGANFGGYNYCNFMTDGNPHIFLHFVFSLNPDCPAAGYPPIQWNNHVQVESLTRKAQLQEVELERTTKQLKEAIAIAGKRLQNAKQQKK